MSQPIDWSALEEKKFNLPFNMSGQKIFLFYSDYWCFSMANVRENKRQRTHKSKTLRTHRQG